MLSYRLLIIALLGLGCLSPVPVQAWALADQRLVPQGWTGTITPLPALTRGDLNGDGKVELLGLERGRLTILQGGKVDWQSPAGWDVRQAFMADLNADDRLEAVLLVWRNFSPWPIDRFLPNPGRISGFQDTRGRSCSIILIGWRNGSYREAWAGSALAEPVKAFAAADLDTDGIPELVTLDARYDDPDSLPSRYLSVWEWNGFGFSLVAHQDGSFRALQAGTTPAGQYLLLVGK